MLNTTSQLFSPHKTSNGTVSLLATATTIRLAYSVWRWSNPQASTKNTFPTAPSTTSDQPCRYNTTDSTSATMTLPDGRKLGYAQYGAPNGRPVFFLHGLAETRIAAAAYDEVARDLNVRIIAPDRPGTGLSSPQPDRRLLDYPKDIEQLAQRLGLESYGVLVSKLIAQSFIPSPSASAHLQLLLTPPGHLRRRLPRPRLRFRLTAHPPSCRDDPLRPRASRHRHARHELVELHWLHPRLSLHPLALRLAFQPAGLCAAWTKRRRTTESGESAIPEFLGAGEGQGGRGARRGSSAVVDARVQRHVCAGDRRG